MATLKILLSYAPHQKHMAALRAAAPGAEFRIATDEAEARRLVVDVDAILGNRYFLQSLPYARKLRWMQSNSVGMDLIIGGGGNALRKITLTCARGVYDDEVADHAVALVLALARGLHRSRDSQRAGEWRREPLRALNHRTAMILGWGGVGRAIARRLLAFGMQVISVRRQHAGPPQLGDDGTRLHGPETWRADLPEVDVLILALPLTERARNYVGPEELAALGKHAYLVNVGRGGVLDEGALFAALRRNQLAGAALDVLVEEPPPLNHPAWRETSLLLTPHVARSPEVEPFRWEPLFVENLRRFANGLPLLNIVDLDAGY